MLKVKFNPWRYVDADFVILLVALYLDCFLQNRSLPWLLALQKLDEKLDSRVSPTARHFAGRLRTEDT